VYRYAKELGDIGASLYSQGTLSDQARHLLGYGVTLNRQAVAAQAL